ncbi:uncharacterized protein LOC134260365 [Saccostrea cucullata]|uniref:uncharacterized protein LOC134260365 n=1 Tax=Saccostrea cuccullata TaxID=36930 RepID=UPI002ED18996
MKHPRMFTLLPFVCMLFLACHAYSVDATDTDEKMKLIKPLMMLTGNVVNLVDKNLCFEKTMCLLGTMKDYNVTNPLAFIPSILSNANSYFQPDAYRRLEDTLNKSPKLISIVQSYHFGKYSQHESVCANRYPECTSNNVKLTTALKQFDDDHFPNLVGHTHQVRSASCDGLNHLCTASSLGCVLCTFSLAMSIMCGAFCSSEVSLTCDVGTISCAIVDNIFG